MEIKKKLIFGLIDHTVRRSRLFRETNDEDLIAHCLSMQNPRGRLLLSLGQYLQNTNTFGRIFLYITNRATAMLSNGTVRGIIENVNRLEVDIDATPLYRKEISIKTRDFIYPYQVFDFTFATFKPEYKPHIFGIFQIFSVNVWITLAVAFFAIALLSHFILKYKCNFGKTILHVFAVLMKQNAIIIPTSFAENLLVYSWVVGAMILCLSHDSVILSFLSFPPLTKIKHLSDLAVAVQKGDYTCIALPISGIENYLRNKKQEHLAVIADNISKNNIRWNSLLNNFINGTKTTGIAFFIRTETMDVYAGKFFVSEDRFLLATSSMSVRRGFCCKELVDAFVHRMMASGIYYKYFSDFTFGLKSSLKFSENETINRKLTLTDLAPAFIFLLCGHFIYLFVLFWEMISKRRNGRIFKTIKKRRIISACSKISVNYFLKTLLWLL